MPALINTPPKSEQPERSKPRPFLDSFAAQAKEVIEDDYLHKNLR